jgi:hypothetical protein
MSARLTPAWHEQAAFEGGGHGGGAVVDAELGVRRTDAFLDRYISY